MKTIYDLSIEELKEYFVEVGEKPFRAKQVFFSLANGKSFSQMTDIKKDLRERLLTEFYDEPTKIIKTLVSNDGTEKYLFQLSDGNIIEGVLMKYKYGYTQCVSTQVGCRMGCSFCASTIGGLVRNLSSGEIISQVITVNKMLGGTSENRKITNVVLMGSGEPLDNFDNVVKFLKLISSPDGINISPRNISLSTCGIVPKMLELATLNLPVNLTLSLHSPFDKERQQLMPIAKTYSVNEVISACKKFFNITGRRVYFEYSLVEGVNDTVECANKLIELLKGFPCHVNLIRLNAVKEKQLLATSEKNAKAFLSLLENGGLSVTIRRQMGLDIDGACGQLRRKFINGDT